MMMIYSLIFRFMAQNGCCVCKVGPGKGQTLGPFAGLFQSLTAQGPGLWCGLGFAWLACGFFVSPGGIFFSLFLGLERPQQQQPFSGFSR